MANGLTLQYRDEYSLSTNTINLINNNTTAIDKNYNLFYPAEVLDIILDNKHPEYKNSYDIGVVKLKLLHEKTNKNIENIIYALPINNNTISYPLVGEIVLVIKIIDKYFYLTSINYLNNVQNNILKNESSNNPVLTSTIENEKIENRNYNKLKYKLLSPNNGDFIIRGRSGNNIRFNSNKSEITISVGQKQNNASEYVENVNEDAAFINISEDNKFNINLATKGKNYYLKSGKNIPFEFNGSNIILNAGRLIFNSKKDEIILTAHKGILLNTNDYIAIDSNENIIFSSKQYNVNANEIVNINSKKINLGKDANEPLVLGNKLIEILSELIDAIIEETHSTGTGPSSPPLNISKFKSIKSKLSKILSKQNKTL